MSAFKGAEYLIKTFLVIKEVLIDLKEKSSFLTFIKNQDLSKNRYRIAVTPETAIRYRLEKHQLHSPEKSTCM